MQSKFFHIYLLCVSTIMFNLKMNGQNVRDLPRNYPGLLAGIEWNTISGMTGVEYERIIIARKSLSAGIKAAYMFPYETGNMQLLASACCDVSTIATALITADLFTSENTAPSGFFFHAAIGIGGKKYEFDTQDKLIRVRPAVEAGAGWLFPLARRFAIKWTNTITFPSKEAGITFTRIAFGF
jgi:hypothetical protein